MTDFIGLTLIIPLVTNTLLYLHWDPQRGGLSREREVRREGIRHHLHRTIRGAIGNWIWGSKIFSPVLTAVSGYHMHPGFTREAARK